MTIPLPVAPAKTLGSVSFLFFARHVQAAQIQLEVQLPLLRPHGLLFFSPCLLESLISHLAFLLLTSPWGFSRVLASA